MHTQDNPTSISSLIPQQPGDKCCHCQSKTKPNIQTSSFMGPPSKPVGGATNPLNRYVSVFRRVLLFVTP